MSSFLKENSGKKNACLFQIIAENILTKSQFSMACSFHQRKLYHPSMAGSSFN